MYKKEIKINVPPFESQDVEFKMALNKEKDKIEGWAKTIAGFANSIGGSILVGVNDEGNIIGLEKKQVDEYKNLVLTTIERYFIPHVDVLFKVEKNSNDKYLLYIIVEPNEKLIIYKDGDYNEKVYIRKDGATVKASIEQIIKLGKRKFGFDNQITNITFIKKNFSKFYKLAKNYRKNEDEPTIKLLISKNIIDQNEKITEGFKMFSNTYDNNLSTIVCRLWNGNDKGVDEVIDKKEITGPLGETFIEATKFISRNTKSGFIKLKDGSRTDTTSYPKIALREAIINAIAHRDYSIEGTQIDIDIFKDRIQITSPGSWLLDGQPSTYSMDEIPSIRRNKIICNCFEIAGLMEKSGSGFKKIYNSYKDYDIKQPTLKSTSDYFVITMYDLLNTETEENSVVLRKYDEEIIKYCLSEPKTRKEIQEHISYKSRQHFTTDILNPLISSKLLIPTEPKQSKKQKYITNKEKYDSLFGY